MEKIQESIDTKQAEYLEAKKKFEKELPIAEENLKAYLISKAEKIVADPLKNVNIEYTYRDSVPDRGSFLVPSKYRLPVEPCEPKAFINKAWSDMKVLSMSSDETISVATDSDWAIYL